MYFAALTFVNIEKGAFGVDYTANSRSLGVCVVDKSIALVVVVVKVEVRVVVIVEKVVSLSAIYL